MNSPPIHYTMVDDLNLAYQVVGDGPIDLIMVDEWATPLEARWDVPAIAGRLNRLASFARVISFDKRGIGLSDHGPSSEMATPELWVRDVVAVADAVGAERPVLFGTHEGGPIALLYAASLPTRTETLILANTGPRMTAAADWPYGVPVEEWRPDLDGIIETWAGGTGGEDHISATAHDPWWQDWYASTRRKQASPGVGLMLMRMLGELDVRHIAATVRSPTLLLHRTGNRWWPVEGARWLEAQIPRAELVELAGADNYWWSGDADAIIDEMEKFLLGTHTTSSSPRELVTIMFTDIVDSTATAGRLGDAEWRAILDQHDSILLAETRRHGGSPLKNLGDGFFLQFDGPAAAIRAAQDIHRSLARSPVSVRISIHTGEANRRGDDLSGIAVHLAARMLDVAAPGETLVSSVVRGLVAGSNTTFEERGRHDFKGVPDTWELYAATAEAISPSGYTSGLTHPR